MGDVHFDTHQVDELAVDFSEGPGRVQRGAKEVLARSASRVQQGLRRDASGHRFLDELPAAVGKSKISDLEWEVGFDKRGQGKLANIIVFGSINNAPVFSHTASLQRDIPRLLDDAAKMAEGVVFGDDPK